VKGWELFLRHNVRRVYATVNQSVCNVCGLCQTPERIKLIFAVWARTTLDSTTVTYSVWWKGVLFRAAFNVPQTLVQEFVTGAQLTIVRLSDNLAEGHLNSPVEITLGLIAVA